MSATLVLVVALSYAGAQVLNASMSGTSDVERARHDLGVRAELRQQTTLQYSSVVYLPVVNTLTIEIKNTGDTVLEVPKTNTLIDGILRDVNVTSVTIGGVFVETWLPGETLVIVVGDVKQSPQFAKVVASNGVAKHWRPA